MLVNFFIQLLEWLFVIGMAGSAVVILISGVEDVETMLETNDHAHEER
jgi:hypothetical protein